MRKFIFGTTALLLAFGAVAFTNISKKKVAKKSPQLYWFQTNPQVSAPPFVRLEDEPYGCQNATTFCAAGWTGETTNAMGQYIPTGTHSEDVLKTN